MTILKKMNTINIESSSELMRMALDPNACLTASTRMLRECDELLHGRSAMAELNCCDPKRIAREFHEIRCIAQRLAAAQTDGTPSAARAQSALAHTADAHTAREAMLAIYQALETQEQHDAIRSAFPV